MVDKKHKPKYYLCLHKGIKCKKCDFIAHTHEQINNHFSVGLSHNFKFGDLDNFFVRLDMEMDRILKKNKPEKVIFT